MMLALTAHSCLMLRFICVIVWCAMYLRALCIFHFMPHYSLCLIQMSVGPLETAVSFLLS